MQQDVWITYHSGADEYSLKEFSTNEQSSKSTLEKEQECGGPPVDLDLWFSLQ
jgi:hypothetical protein